MIFFLLEMKYNPSHKPFFYYVPFKNQNTQPITVTWDDRNTDDTTLEPGALFVYRDIKMSASRPDDIGFRVIDKSTGREVAMNGRTKFTVCLLYTSPSPRDGLLSRMPSSA